MLKSLYSFENIQYENQPRQRFLFRNLTNINNKFFNIILLLYTKYNNPKIFGIAQLFGERENMFLNYISKHRASNFSLFGHG